MIVLTYIQVKKKKWLNVILRILPGRSLFAEWLLRQGDSCSKVTPAARWLLQQGDSCIKVAPESWWFLQHCDSCNKMTPASKWLLNQGDTCSKVTPASRWFLQQCYSCIKATPAAMWLLQQGDTYSKVTPASGWLLQQCDSCSMTNSLGIDDVEGRIDMVDVMLEFIKGCSVTTRWDTIFRAVHWFYVTEHEKHKMVCCIVVCSGLYNEMG